MHKVDFKKRFRFRGFNLSERLGEKVKKTIFIDAGVSFANNGLWWWWP
jgi:hypothetical protein